MVTEELLGARLEAWDGPEQELRGLAAVMGWLERWSQRFAQRERWLLKLMDIEKIDANKNVTAFATGRRRTPRE